MLGRIAWTCSVAAGVVFASGAFAQSATDMAARGDLLRQAQAASTAGDHARALDLGQRAAEIQWTPSVRLFVAQEQRQVGQLAAGLGNAELCEREANDDTQLANREIIHQTCRDLAAAIRPTVGHVVVHVPEPTPAGLEVHVGATVLNSAFYGQGYVVDPGSVHIAASVAGSAPFNTDVTVAAGQTQDVTVAFAASSVPPAATSGSLAGTASPTTGPGIAPFIVAGAGVLVFASSGIYYALQQQALSHCTAAGPGAVTCSSRDASDAQTWNLLTNGAFVAGGVIVLAGVAWYAIAKLTSRHSDVHASLVPIQNGGFLNVGGSF